jgi:hypothetical protein
MGRRIWQRLAATALVPVASFALATGTASAAPISAPNVLAAAKSVSGSAVGGLAGTGHSRGGDFAGTATETGATGAAPILSVENGGTNSGGGANSYGGVNSYGGANSYGGVNSYGTEPNGCVKYGGANSYDCAHSHGRRPRRPAGSSASAVGPTIWLKG